MTDQTSIPFVEGHFTWPSDEPRLLGSQCSRCSTSVFPRTFTCPNPSCDGGDVADVEFERTGTLASYTVVHYPPPPPFVAPDPFEPFAIAEVEFANGVQVIGPVPQHHGLQFELGQVMETIVDKYYIDHDGNSVIGWKFQPIGEVS